MLSQATLLIAMMTPEKLQAATVLGLPVHLSADYPHWLHARLQMGDGAHIVTLNAEMAMLAQRDRDLAAIIQQAELVVPDGAGVVFYLRLRDRHQPRCPGIELAAATLEALDRGPLPDKRVFFYGGTPGRAEAAIKVWEQRCPKLELRSAHGYLDANEQDDLVDQLRAWKPQIVLVGLGVPRQEAWIVRHREACPQALWMGIGGSFDIWSGAKERAPHLWRKLHLEWLYRLYQEPWRWRRMGALPQFAWRAIADDRSPSTNGKSA